ncbi:MAG: hypothetical protein ABI604_05795 [Nitrospirota bacterium]
MDKGADRIAQDIKDIVQSRVAIAEKLGLIEQHLGTTMQHARTTMTEVANKTSSAVNETLQSTKEAVDPRIHIARHPWVFVGGTLVFGYAVGALYRRGWRINGAVPADLRGAKGAPIMPMSGSPSSEQQQSGDYPFYPSQRETETARGKQGSTQRPTVLSELGQALQDELDVVRASVVGFGRGLIREMIRQAVPALLQRIAGNRRERSHRSTSGFPH